AVTSIRVGLEKIRVALEKNRVGLRMISGPAETPSDWMTTSTPATHASPWLSGGRRRPSFPTWGARREFFGLSAPAHEQNALPRVPPSGLQGRSLCSRR